MSSPSPGPCSEVPFTPRKEFIRESLNQPNSFALLALSGPNCIRLYSFVHLAVASIRRLLERSTLIISAREDATQNLYEFALDGKPWANPKSAATEKLLVDIIAVIYQSGYTHLSLIDYGREADDRLAMTFSKPAIASRSPTPLPSSNSAKVNGSASSFGETCLAKRIPFAISFSSVTVMRVISPPLHLTPAILQAVRASWPRGVVAEKKVAENSYEFKLKGYKWFQQDTFATDSLRHILSLLSSLDAHSFTLLTSISLTNRSRVKDLWVFTGPAPEDGLFPSSDHALETMSGRVPRSLTDQTRLSPENQFQHRKLATDPPPVIPQSPIIQHPRASTESPTQPRFPHQGQVLRKPAPRAQVPVSVVHDSDNADELREIEPVRTHMPSTISAGVENMTGIGASPNIFYATSPFDATALPSNESRSVPPLLNQNSPSNSGRPTPQHDRIPPLLDSPQMTSFSPYKEHIPHSPVDVPVSASMNLPLLGLGAFRDSEISSNSEMSHEIPIKWAGPLQEGVGGRLKLGSSCNSSGPKLPGAWQPTPIAEKTEEEAGPPSSEEKKDSTTPIHELGSRFEMPQIVRPEMPLRKSEAALVGIIHSTSPPPPVPSVDRPNEKGSSAGGGQGWVLPFSSPHENALPGVNKEQLSPYPTPEAKADPKAVQEPQYEQASPAARAIVIVDAMNFKHQKSSSTSASKLPGESASSVRRFFSLSRKASKKDGDKQKDRDRSETDRTATHSIQRSNLRDRLRLIGTPEASRREDKRRSID
ncbi:hypothetical protein CPB84DRAFT_1759610 [Gymnopilus junonius]|uniref:Uncharacterized protein n=1 Tax=Gymnopilus junonius TaxID=109634 RepID=A0A9P5P206_GYMJU|nr:hypothetical protein CPB84DRAFT_1759610 [Gymnopilus junonius]